MYSPTKLYIKSDPSKISWVEMGLVDDAPMSAKLAFDKFMEIVRYEKERGIEV